MRKTSPILLLFLLAASPVVGGERSAPGASSARTYATPRGGELPRALDPAVEQYWSDACRRERDFGMTTSPNCHHPAYTGGGYGYGPGRPPRHPGHDWPGHGWGRGGDWGGGTWDRRGGWDGPREHLPEPPRTGGTSNWRR